MIQNNKMNIVPISAFYLSLKKALMGKEQLWIVFWGWFVALLLLCWTIRFLLDSSINKWILGPLPLFYLNIAFAITITVATIFRVLLVVMVWRCAPNTNHNIWRYVARIVVILFALLSVYGLAKSINHAFDLSRAITILQSVQKGDSHDNGSN